MDAKVINLKFVNALLKSASQTHGDIEFRKWLVRQEKCLYKYVGKSDKKDWWEDTTAARVVTGLISRSHLVLWITSQPPGSRRRATGNRLKLDFSISFWEELNLFIVVLCRFTGNQWRIHEWGVGLRGFRPPLIGCPYLLCVTMYGFKCWFKNVSINQKYISHLKKFLFGVYLYTFTILPIEIFSVLWR